MEPIVYHQIDRKKGISFLAVYFLIVFGILFSFAGLNGAADFVNCFFANGIELLLLLSVVVFIVPAIFIVRKIYGRCEMQIIEKNVSIKTRNEIIEIIELSEINSFEFIKIFNSLELFDSNGGSLHKFKVMDITGSDITKINNAFVKVLPLELTKREKKFLGTRYEIFRYRRKL